MVVLRDVIDDVFAVLRPLQSCGLNQFEQHCVDPVVATAEAYPLWCECDTHCPPSLPQHDRCSEQLCRADELKEARKHYRYDYSLMRTYKVIEVKGRKRGVKGPGIAVLAKLPLEQMPSCFWLMMVLKNGLIVIENLLAVIRLTLRGPSRDCENRPEAELHEKPGAAIAALPASDEDLDELSRRHDDLQKLHDDLATSYSLLRRTAHHVEGAPYHHRTESWMPPTEASTESSSSLCSCIRCSPQSIHHDVVASITDDLSNAVGHILALPVVDRHPRSIKAYNDLFQEIPLPEFAHQFRSDEVFALQRVSGQNPVVIESVRWTAELAARFPVTDEQYQRVMGPLDTLEQAGNEDRLYLCDYDESLKNTISGDFPPFAGQKYLFVPLALFALEREDRTSIKAIAIQCQQEPGDDNPVITPDGGWNWEIAKTVVQNADCNDSEYREHLGLAHLLTEAFILATYRQLPKQHPLYVLLTPHFQGTLFTNNAAITSINKEGSYLNITESIFSGTVPSTLGIAANAVHKVNFTENMLFTELAKRGVANRSTFPNYPYRDDATLVWNAIHRWSEDYIRLYYTCDRDVREDYELQKWVAEVSAWDGGRIQGVGENGISNNVKTVDYLIDCIAQVIFTASAHHALANFPLSRYELYTPGCPGALYRDAPTKAYGATREEWLSYFAPLSIAILQQFLGFVVGSTYFTQLGEYAICQFVDPRVREPLHEFQQELRNVEKIINQRNRQRPLYYPFLLPSEIPQSTNI